MRELTLLAPCNTVFSLPVKTNSDEDSASARCNRAVIPADSREEHPSINIHTPSNRFQTYPKSETIHRVPAHIFIWSESYPVLTSDDAFWDWHAVTGCFSQKASRGIFFSPSVFFIWRSGWLVDASSFVLSPRVTSALTWLQLMAVAGTGSLPTLYLDFFFYFAASSLIQTADILARRHFWSSVWPPPCQARWKKKKRCRGD